MKLHQSHPARTPRLSLSQCHAWCTALASCHGMTILWLDVPAALRMASTPRALHNPAVATVAQSNSVARIDAEAWPFARQSLTAVAMLWTPSTVAHQPRVLTEIDQCLADDGHVLMLVNHAHLAQWCRAGMAQAQALGWQLEQQYWGDNRRLSLLPKALANVWVAPWQRYLPVAQWCVQLWQKNTYRLSGLSDNSSRSVRAWPAAAVAASQWPRVQGSARTTHLRNDRISHE